ncbi:MAG: single-stranded-DNA-specific exonuclease RecJ [Pseudomonadota bacterium]
MTAVPHVGPIADAIALPDVDGAASGRRWRLRDAEWREVEMMRQRLDIDQLLARVLSARGVTAEAASDFLEPSLRQSLPDPYVLHDMECASAILADAVQTEAAIGVFGDYDVDGTSAAAILWSYFDALGRETPVYLPDRITEGYGPSIEAFRALREAGAEIIVTVDCGAAAHEAINAAAAEGMKVIVLDHHLMDGPPPAGAEATVNPNRPDDISGLTNLSAAGVAFMTLVALNRRLREAGWFASRSEPRLTEFLDLTALGLVCDVMALTGLTRVLVAQGLKILEGGGNAGLKALAERAGAKGPASVYHLGFLIGPRINAAGRIGHARLAFELLTTKEPARRIALAEKLHVMNAERQAIEADVQREALKLIADHCLDADDVIVAAGEGWHPGVIGIVAGRIKEKLDKPVIVIGVENGVGKGSGRSIDGVDLGRAVASARDDGVLINGGGHAMAAGLTINASRIDDLRERLNVALEDAVDVARQNRQLMIDAVIAPEAVARPLVEATALAGPFGVGNPEPVFALSDLRVAHLREVGENHIAATLKGASGAEVRAIAFRAKDEPLGDVLRSNARIHVAGKVRPDDWRGGLACQLQIVDAAPAS